jgi:hypothetical protein
MFLFFGSTIEIFFFSLPPVNEKLMQGKSWPPKEEEDCTKVLSASFFMTAQLPDLDVSGHHPTHLGVAQTQIVFLIIHNLEM